MSKIKMIRDSKKKKREIWACGIIVFITTVLGRPLTRDLNFIYRVGLLILIGMLLFWTYRVIDNLISKKISNPKADQKQ